MKGSERDLLVKVKDAIYANPFGPDRLALDLSATGMSGDAPSSEILARLVDDVGQTIARIRRRLEQKEPHLRAGDRDLLQHAALFYIFHRFCSDFDTHIEEQIDQGDQCCPVSFAAEALSQLTAHGFGEKAAVRLFALFFQMRRAYFFISGIAGKSDCVQKLRSALWRNIFTSDLAVYEKYLWNRMEDFSTMILGGTGSGKTMAATAIGRSGFIPFDTRTKRFAESFTRAFVSINLSQFPEPLIESELFGHKKGAFTGAVESHRGIFSRCSPCGAIFIDEIGEIGIPIQIKLLQVLEERIFTPVGSHAARRFQGRVIAATNRSIEESRRQGRFRDDFYYRLCSDIIHVPPLKQRIQEHPGELEEILSPTIRRMLGKPSDELTDRISTTIRRTQPPDYGWPGNIRELEQCVRQVLLNRRCAWQPQQPHGTGEGLIDGLTRGSLTAEELLTLYCRRLYRRHGTYEAVARRAGIDRRTAKKYIDRNAVQNSRI